MSRQGRSFGCERKSRHLLAACFAALCAGCVHYRAAPLESRHSSEQFAARQLTDPKIRDEIAHLLPQAASTWPPQAWNRADLLAVALVRNPELAVARAQVRVVQAHELTAVETPNPDLTLQSEYARHDPYPWLYGLSLNWLLRSGERRSLAGEAARLDTGNARLDLMEHAWGVRRTLTSALSERELARRRLSLLDRLAASQEGLLRFEQQRVTSGEDPPSELLATQRARIDIEQQQSEQRVIAGAAQAAAAKALGVPPRALDGITLAWPDWGEPPSVNETKLRAAGEEALLSRPDLRIAIGEYAAAETKLHQAVARQYPQLVLEPGFYWDHGIAKFPFDLGFTLPLNRNKNEIAEARAGRALAGQHMLAVQADIFGEIAAAERAEKIAYASATVAEQQVQAARQQEQQSALSFRLGEMNSPERIGAEILATRAELELVQMRAQLQTSRDTLEDVLRAPLSGPELALAKSMSSGGS